MTTEIATLGLAIDSRPAVTATKALDDLTAAAKPASQAADALEKATSEAAGAATELQNAVRPATAAIDKLNTSAGSKAVPGLAANLNDIPKAATAAATALAKLRQEQVAAFAGMGGGAGSDFGGMLQQGQYLDDLRAKYNPLFAAQRAYKEQLVGINSAARQGAISEKERADAIGRTKKEFAEQIVALRGGVAANTALAASTTAAAGNTAQLATQTGLARHELINFGRQMQDVGTMLAMGASPMQVFTSQAAQIVDIFASSRGTVGGFFKQMASGVASVITPARLLGGGIVTIGASLALAANSWNGAQKEIQLGLMGIGRASGATVGDINRIADATSSLRGLSVSEARETATALASTGKIGVESIERLTGQTKNFAAVLGLDVPKAAEVMSKIFANPSEGAKTLADRIGGIDAATIRSIDTLEKQGDRQGAIKALIDATIPAIQGAADKTGNLAKGWNTVSNAASNAWTSIGRATAESADQRPQEALEARRAELEKLISTTKQLNETDSGTQRLFNDQQLKAYNAELAQVNTALQQVAASRKAALGVDAAATTNQIAPIVNALAPAPELIRVTNANLEAMKRIMSDPAFEEFRSKMGDQLPLALSRLSAAAKLLETNPDTADPVKNQINNLRLQTKLLNDQSPAMRARVESQIAYNEAIKQGANEEQAAAIAKARGALASGGPMANISQQQQYLALLGSTASATDAVRMVELNLQAARIQGIRIDDERAATLKRLAVENSLGLTAIRANTDALNTETATLGMSVGAATEYAAVQNAINEARRNGRTLSADNIAAIRAEAGALGEAAQRADLMRSAYTGLVQGPLQTLRSSIASGSTFFDALKKSAASALDSISSKLMDMAAQKLWQNALGGSSGGGFLSGLTNLFGFGGGSAAPTMGAGGLAAIHHTGYGPGDTGAPTRFVPSSTFANAPRFHAGIGPGERAAIIRDDESVLTPGQMRQLAPVGAGSSGGPVQVDVGVSVDNDGNLQAYVKSVTQRGINDFAGSKQFVNSVGAASRKATGQRKL